MSDAILTNTGALSAPAAREYFRTAEAISTEYRFFHWELEYPEVFFGANGSALANGGFDAVLKQEQQRVAREHDTRAAETGGSATTEAQSADKTGSADAAGTAATETPRAGEEGSGNADKHRGSDKRAARPGDLKSEKAGKVDDNAGNGATAREIPDGSDDDVVARRLRKAAEQETDPELKEKLWHEYIEYKKNTQGK